MFGVLSSHPGTTPYLQWFFACAFVLSLLIMLIGLKRPS